MARQCSKASCHVLFSFTRIRFSRRQTKGKRALQSWVDIFWVIEEMVTQSPSFFGSPVAQFLYLEDPLLHFHFFAAEETEFQRVFSKFFMIQFGSLKTEAVTAVQIVKPSEANNICDFGIKINLMSGNTFKGLTCCYFSWLQPAGVLRAGVVLYLLCIGQSRLESPSERLPSSVWCCPPELPDCRSFPCSSPELLSTSWTAAPVCSSSGHVQVSVDR